MPQPLRMLIVEDNPADAELLVRQLRRADFAPDWKRVDTEPEFLASLDAPLDVILSDYEMPQFSGLRALELVKQRGLEIPFIIVSGTIGEETAVAAMRQGAADYLLKDRLARLGPAIHHAVEEARLRRERKQSEAALRESEARFAKAFYSNPAAMCITTVADGRFIEINERYAALFDFSREALIGRTSLDMALWADPTERDCAVERLQTHRVVRDFEARFRRRNGEVIDALISMEPIEFARERDPVIISMFTDITERKKLEQQFLRAQRMESIGTLASGVAHDLNNILSPIMMSVPMLRRKLTAKQLEGIVSTIEMSAARGAEVVRQVLTFGRGLEGEKRALSLASLITEIMKIMRGTFPKNVTVESSIGSGLWPVIGDATQLHQVLLNLCVNARDAMPKGGSLQLRAANLEVDSNFASMAPGAVPGPHVLLEVSDNGSGIAPEIVERIFDPFFTTKGIGKGTGLGLSTVHGIVQSHGGFLKVNTQLGKGTTFQIYLPASPTHEAALPDDTRAEVPGGDGELVLVVDDEANVRHSARLALEATGYRVLVAADGTEALALFVRNSGSIAVMLTDLMMPHMDGVTLIRALRAMAPSLPIIASTGLGDKTQFAELKAMGVKSVLPKPYGGDVLLRTIHDLLHPARSSTDS